MKRSETCKEIPTNAPAVTVWVVARDLDASTNGTRLRHRRQTRRREPRTNFGNGLVGREQFVDIDDEYRRLAYTIAKGRACHYNGAIQWLARVTTAPGGEREHGKTKAMGEASIILER